jgi:transcriptional regulator with XRE-family HTH domain
MKRKPKFIEGKFGKTLGALRKARGLTQKELGVKIGVSQRMINYYECEAHHPPVALLPDLARALNVSLEQLFGIKAIKDPTLIEDKRLMRRLKMLKELSPTDQGTVLALIKSLHKNSNHK